MNIAIAGRSMNTPGGVKAYLEGLCYGLSSIEIPHNVKVYFFMTQKGSEPHYTKGVHVIKAGSENRFFWDYCTLPKLLRQHKIDAVLHVKNTIPPTVLTPSVVVVHDLLHILQPEVYKTSDALYMKILMRRSLPKAKKIIAVSENTKKDLLKTIPSVKEKNVSVIYEDALPSFDSKVSEQKRNTFRKKNNLPERFLLFTGSLSPRKNLLGLFHAFAKIHRRVPHHLVITGGKSWKSFNLLEHVQALGIQEKIHILGFVQDDDMPTLYQCAETYIYPSFYEGFGIPIIEAFASGIPVLSSNTSSLPEVGGDAVEYFDPKNIDEMSQKIEQVLMSTERQQRLRQKGFEQRRKFSWKSAAKDLLQILISAADNSGRSNDVLKTTNDLCK